MHHLKQCVFTVFYLYKGSLYTKLILKSETTCFIYCMLADNFPVALLCPAAVLGCKGPCTKYDGEVLEITFSNSFPVGNYQQLVMQHC